MPWMVLLVVLSDSLGTNEVLRLCLKGDDHVPAFQNLIAVEIDQAVFVAADEPADGTIILESTAEYLVVRMLGASGNELLKRQISTRSGLAPALRVAVLLIADIAGNTQWGERTPPNGDPGQDATPPPAEAVSDPPKHDKADIAPRTEEQPSQSSTKDSWLRGWRVAVGPALVWWKTPATPQLGAQVTGYLQLEAVSLGLRAWTLGLGCCARSNRDLQGRAIETGVLALIDRQLWNVRSLEVRLSAGAGVNYLELHVLPKGEPRAKEVKFTLGQGLISTSLLVDISFWDDRIYGAVEAGILVKLNAHKISLPTDFAAESLHTGNLVPQLSIAVGMRFF